MGIKVVAIITEANDKILLTLQVLENFRSDLNHFEECRNFVHMLSTEYFKNQGELAKTFGITPGKISQVMSLKVIPLWLQKEYLTKKKLIPGQEYYKIEVAPLASLRGEFVKKLEEKSERLNGTEGLQGYLLAGKTEYENLSTWQAKIKFILGYFNPEKPARTYVKHDIEVKLKTDRASYGSFKASREKGVELKISRRNYSKELAEELLKAVNEVIDKYIDLFPFFQFLKLIFLGLGGSVCLRKVSLIYLVKET